MTTQNGNENNAMATDRPLVSFGDIAVSLGIRPEAVAAVVRKRKIPHTKRPPFIFVDFQYLDEIREVFSPPVGRI